MTARPMNAAATRFTPAQRRLSLLVSAGGSAALLAGAFLFQALGYAPCKLCLYQRWPHAAAVLIGLVALAMPRRWLWALGALAAATSGAIGVFHSGVEQGWWQGPTTCSSGSVAGLSPDELLNQIMNAPLVRCNEIAWQFLGLSMASWNALASFALAAIWIWAWRRA